MAQQVSGRQPRYKRILLKLSGEALMGSEEFGIDPKVLDRMADLGVWRRADVADAKIEPVVARQLQPPLSAALLAQRLHSANPKAARIVSTIASRPSRRNSSFSMSLPRL